MLWPQDETANYMVFSNSVMAIALESAEKV